MHKPSRVLETPTQNVRKAETPRPNILSTMKLTRSSVTKSIEKSKVVGAMTPFSKHKTTLHQEKKGTQIHPKHHWYIHGTFDTKSGRPRGGDRPVQHHLLVPPLLKVQVHDPSKDIQLQTSQPLKFQSFAFPKSPSTDADHQEKQKKEKKREEFPRRHKPVVQRQGHRAARVASRAQADKGGKN